MFVTCIVWSAKKQLQCVVWMYLHTWEARVSGIDEELRTRHFLSCYIFAEKTWNFYPGSGRPSVSGFRHWVQVLCFHVFRLKVDAHKNTIRVWWNSEACMYAIVIRDGCNSSWFSKTWNQWHRNSYPRSRNGAKASFEKHLSQYKCKGSICVFKSTVSSLRVTFYELKRRSLSGWTSW